MVTQYINKQYYIGDRVTIVPYPLFEAVLNSTTFYSAEMSRFCDNTYQILTKTIVPDNSFEYILGRLDSNIPNPARYVFKDDVFTDSYTEVSKVNEQNYENYSRPIEHGDLVFHKTHTRTRLDGTLAPDNIIFFADLISEPDRLIIRYQNYNQILSTLGNKLTKEAITNNPMLITGFSKYNGFDIPREDLAYNRNLVIRSDLFFPSIELSNVLLEGYYNIGDINLSKLDIPDILNLKDCKHDIRKISYYNEAYSVKECYGFLIPNTDNKIATLSYNGVIKTINISKVRSDYKLLPSDIIAIAAMYLKVKIKSCENSIKLWGHGKIKSKMFKESIDNNQLYTINKILFNYDKNGKVVHAVEVYNKDLNKNFKFELSDLEFTKFNYNSYNPPKDKHIIKNCNARIIKDKLLPVSKNTIVKVLELNKVNKNVTKVIVQADNKKFKCNIKNLKRV
jgi:hypothetical protein